MRSPPTEELDSLLASGPSGKLKASVIWDPNEGLLRRSKNRSSHVLVVVAELIIEVISLAQGNGALLAFADLIGPEKLMVTLRGTASASASLPPFCCR